MVNKIFITGSGGFVGKNIYRILKNQYQVFGVDQKKAEFVDAEINLSEQHNLLEILNNFKPELVIHSAAYSNVDGCESNGRLAYDSNILPVKTLVEWAKKNGSKIIFISSDYVYDGNKGHFTENDETNPLQYYGQTKLDGERLISELENYVILRPTVIYGWDDGGKNFFMQLYNNQLACKAMNVPIDQVSNPTFIGDLCDLITKLIRQSNLKGVFLTTGRESFGRYDFALKICEKFGWNKGLIIPKKTAELGQLAKRPLNNSTDSSKICRILDFEFKSLDQSLSIIKELLP